MNAAETIAAAIEKLEGQRSASDDNATPSTWVVEEGGACVSQYYAPDEERMEVIGRDIWPADSELIVTLHRTIDAQLAILENALIDYAASGTKILADTLDLARAILGEQS